VKGTGAGTADEAADNCLHEEDHAKMENSALYDQDLINEINVERPPRSLAGVTTLAC